MIYTYILYSPKDGRWYVGVTENLRARIRDHTAGRVHFTKSKPSMLLAYYEACVSKEDAYRRERYLKSGRGKRYIRQRLSDWLSNMWPIKLERH